MSRSISSRELNFSEACEYLSLPPDELTALREAGLVAIVRQQGRQFYSEDALGVTKRLLHLAQEYKWELSTLAWFADLSYASCVGRVVLLPLNISDKSSDHQSSNWMGSPALSTILGDFESAMQGVNEAFINILRSIIAIGEEQFWAGRHNLERSALYPIVVHLEQQNIPILNQGHLIARDSSPIFVALVFTFTAITSPLSRELAQLIETVQSKFQMNEHSSTTATPADRALIEREALIAVDRLYATQAPQIHSQPDHWTVKDGRLGADRKSIRLVLQLPLEIQEGTEPEAGVIDNILDLIRPYVGPFGARVVHLLYEIANDPPNWRNPVITVRTNDLLDRLGLKRDKRGIHYSENRERLRDALNSAHYLEIIGEYPDWEDGRRVVKVLRRTVLSLIGATFDEEERQGIPTEDLLQRGLPKAIQIRLNFYDGVRQVDGRLGDKYILVPRLAAPDRLAKANHASTYEALTAYILLRCRQLQPTERVLRITRRAALEQAGIRNKNPRQATITLRNALDKLVQKGILESFSPNLPKEPNEEFEVVIALDALSYSDKESGNSQ